MAEKKKKSKFKKILKNLGKVAMLGTLGYGASKMFGGRKKKYGQDAGFLKSGAAGGPYGPTPFHPAQGNLSKWQKMARNYPDAIMDGRNVGVKLAPEGRSWGSYFGLKKGGRVTGIAKRGFGRALMKGKK